MGIVASIIGMSFFSSVSQFLRLNYSQIAFLRKRLQLDSKTDWITNGLILGFFLEYGFFHWLQIHMDSNLHELLKLDFLDDIKSFR